MFIIFAHFCQFSNKCSQNFYLIAIKKLVPWGTDGRLPLSDLDLGSGHTAYHRASLIDPLPTYQMSLRSEENFFESHH